MNIEAWERERIQGEQMKKQQQQKIHMEAGMEVKQKEAPSTMEQWKTQIDQLQKQIIEKNSLPKNTLVKNRDKWIKELISLQNQIEEELIRTDKQEQILLRRIQRRKEYELGVETFLANIFGAAQSAGQEPYRPTEMTQIEWEESQRIYQYKTQLEGIKAQIELMFKLLTIR